MSLPNIHTVSDEALLDMYARAKTNMMLCSLFPKITLSPDVVEFVRALSKEITDRGLDNRNEPAN